MLPETAPGDAGPVELHDVIVIETTDGARFDFEVVGIVEDEDGRRYAVCYSEALDEAEDAAIEPLLVTDEFGHLIENEELAQEILDDFLAHADDVGEEEPVNGRTGDQTP